MGDKKDGGPAFPAMGNTTYSGMSLRDWFAGQALTGLAPKFHGQLSLDDNHAKWISVFAYAIADAMLSARSTPKGDE